MGCAKHGVLPNDEWNSLVCSMLSPSSHKYHDTEILYDMTMKEIAKGKAEGLFSKHDLDMKFGRNRWRASK
eukprot:9885861-Karenia_brevis.AAC.1